MGIILQRSIDIIVMICNLEIPVFPNQSISVKAILIGGLAITLSIKFIRGLFS